jgi:hypothetical protein
VAQWPRHACSPLAGELASRRLVARQACDLPKLPQLGGAPKSGGRMNVSLNPDPSWAMLPAMKRFFGPVLSLAFALAGCVNVRTEPIEVKPIHITVDVNVKIEKALNDFFGDLDKKSTTLNAPKS